jgi:hypothetical protein
MKLYRVEFSHSAESELIASITWGIEYWGEESHFSGLVSSGAR